ncbi:MAG TPA: hypothetical protein VG944_08555, partial [Fimbriimonas sp.]|nr:hypothetical protein [Fimbriimonas sp.]
NHLLALGKEKIIATLCEYERLASLPFTCPNGLFWLARMLFKSKNGGVIEQPRFGVMSPVTVSSAIWPDYPVINEDDIPFGAIIGQGTVGAPLETFAKYAARDSKNWVLRDRPIIPPRDPFRSASSAVSFVQRNVSPELSGSCRHQVNEWIISQLQDLVGSKLRRTGEPSDEEDRPFWRRFNELHCEFLAEHMHWNSIRQMYVGLHTPPGGPPKTALSP